MMDMETRYVAAMVLSGVGDALGYKNGSWEFCYSGELIHKEAEELGGVENIEVTLPGWRVSDDTVMHLGLAQALSTNTAWEDKEDLYSRIAHQFKLGMDDMYGRGPGPTTMSACGLLKPEVRKGYCIPFNPRGGGCGAAMRSMCIGLRYHRPEEINDLVAVSIEAGRMTHHHPTGYLGSLASALFTSYAIQGKPLKHWGWGLVYEVLPKAKDYIITREEYVNENVNSWNYFQNKWIEYLDTRCLYDGEYEPFFPPKYGVKERDDFYNSLSFDGWGGASGHDAPMIAYDALLSSNGDWKELCSRAMFHSGDSDSTGVIAACCYGAMKGFEGVPECNYKHLEKRKELKEAAVKIYALSYPDGISTDSLKPEKEEKTGSISAQLPNLPPNEDPDKPEDNHTEKTAVRRHSDDITADSKTSENDENAENTVDKLPLDPSNDNLKEPGGDTGENIVTLEQQNDNSSETLESEKEEKTETMVDELPQVSLNEDLNEPSGDAEEKNDPLNQQDDMCTESFSKSEKKKETVKLETHL